MNCVLKIYIWDIPRKRKVFCVKTMKGESISAVMGELKSYRACQRMDDWLDDDGNPNKGIDYSVEIKVDGTFKRRFFLSIFLEEGVWIDGCRYRILGGTI